MCTASSLGKTSKTKEKASPDTIADANGNISGIAIASSNPVFGKYQGLNHAEKSVINNTKAQYGINTIKPIAHIAPETNSKTIIPSMATAP